MANQDLQTNLLELNQILTKLNSDHSKTLQQLQHSLGQVELVKSQQETMAATMGTMKTKHDQEQHILRRNNGILQRDITLLKKRLDDTTTDLKICRAKLAIKSTVNSDTKGGNTTIDSEHQHQHHGSGHNHNNPSDDLSESGTKSTHLKPSLPDTSILSTTLQHTLGMETLKQSLGHAHRMNSHLRSILQKEKVEKIELRRLLLDAQEAMEQIQQAPINDKLNSRNGNSNGSGGRPSRVSKGSSRFKGSRKQDRMSKKNTELGDDRRGTLALNTTSRASKQGGGTETDLISMNNNNDILSGDDHMDDTSPLYSEDDSSSDDQRLEISPLGGSLDMELGALGRSFKSLSSELEESFTKRQYFDKGVNTHDDDLSAQQQSAGIDSGIVACDQTIHIPNNHISKCTKRSPTTSPVPASHHNSEFQQPPISTATLQRASVSLQHISMDSKHPLTASTTEYMEPAPPALPLPIHIDLVTNQEGRPRSPALKTGPIFDPHPPVPSTTTIATANDIPSSIPDRMGMDSSTPYTSEKVTHDDITATINDISATDLVRTTPPADCTNDDGQSLSSSPSNQSSSSLSPSMLSTTHENSGTELGSGNIGIPEMDGPSLSGLETLRDSDKIPTLDTATSVVGDRQTIPLASEDTSPEKSRSPISGAPEFQLPVDADHGDTKQPIFTHNLQDTFGEEDLIACSEQVTASATIDTTIVAEECALEHGATNGKNLANHVSDTISKKEVAILAQDNDNPTTNDDTAYPQLKVYNRQQQSFDGVKATPTKSLFLFKAAASRQSTVLVPRAASRQEIPASPIPSPIPSTSTLSTTTTTASPSRFGILSGLMNLQPSQSTPTKPDRPRPTPSTSSLRQLFASTSTTVANPRQAFSRQPHKRNSLQNHKDHHRDDLDRHSKRSAPGHSYGTVRITENATYSRTVPSPLRSRQQPLTKRFLQPSHHSEHRCDVSSSYTVPSSNADLVLAITQTMIGEWMWKNTRRHVGSGISENKHKRFFWVHPYTRTLYWGTSEPGIDADEAKAKSGNVLQSY